MGFNTVTDYIFGRCTELIEYRFPDEPRAPGAYKCALEHCLRVIPGLAAAIDGWRLLEIVEETADTLHAIGLSYVLPAGELPIDARFELAGDSVRYRILVGVDGGRWRAHTASKRWKAVYTYAVDGTKPAWDWEPPLLGMLESQSAVNGDSEIPVGAD